MAHCNTIFAQFLKLVSRHEFEVLAKQHHAGRSFRSASRWSQFTCLVMAQLTGRSSLRDIVDAASSQVHRLYHLGSSKPSRSNLARVNEGKPYQLYEALFYRLLQRCQPQVPGHGFRFKNRLYSLDASLIHLCLSVFPWASYKHKKGAVKLHVGLNHAGYLPEFVTVTAGSVHEVNIGKFMAFPKGSIVVFDRGYVDYGWYKELNDKGLFFVTRQKKNADYRVVKGNAIEAETGISSDEIIEFRGKLAARACPIRLRRIGYRDPDTNKHYVFITNHMKLSAKTIAAVYRSRWQIELFFKCIKQNLKIKSFIGTSANAVMTQIWVAMCVYLILAFIRFQSGLQKTVQQMVRLLQVNLFEKRDLWALFRGEPPPGTYLNTQQIALL